MRMRCRIAHAPGPAPRGSVVLHIPLPRCSDDVGPTRSLYREVSHLTKLRITGGDFNPACLKRFRVRLVPDGLTLLPCGRVRCLHTCRWPPTPAVPAIAVASHGSTVAWESDSVSGAFSIFAGRFPARRRKEIYRDPRESPMNSTYSRNSYPPRVASSELGRS
jgi:hypothetical protein